MSNAVWLNNIWSSSNKILYIRPVRFYVFQFRFEFDSIKFKTSIFDSVFDFQNIFDSIFDSISIFNTPVSLYHIYLQGLQACTSIMQMTYNLQACNM